MNSRQSLQGEANVFQAQKEVLRVCGRALPLRDEVLVEGTHLGGFSVDQQATAADGRTETCDTLDDIEQEGRSKTLPFVALIHPEARQKGHSCAI